jgi:nucleotidyltransferase substrate binding protein (TIGR01987 family)
MSADTAPGKQLESFGHGLSLLRQALQRGPDSPSPLEKEGAIRRFEYCLELAWKTALEYLQASGLRVAPVTPRETLRQAAASRIVPDAQVWIDMFNHRNLLAHNYDGVVIGEVTYALAAHYFPAMEHLHNTLATHAAETVAGRQAALPRTGALTPRED